MSGSVRSPVSASGGTPSGWSRCTWTVAVNGSEGRSARQTGGRPTAPTSIWCRAMPPVLSPTEIHDVNTRYHDLAAEHYDSKWGIDFGELGCAQVLAKLRKALGQEPGRYPRSLEIGAGTGYFTLNMMRAGVIGEATCTDISQGMLSVLQDNAHRSGCSVSTEPAEAESLPFTDGSFELVFGHA